MTPTPTMTGRFGKVVASATLARMAVEKTRGARKLHDRKRSVYRTRRASMAYVNFDPDTFWHPYSPDWRKDFLAAVQWFNRDGRQPGTRQGPIGNKGAYLLWLVVNRADPITGRFEYSIEQLARMMDCNPDTVTETKKRLSALGLLTSVQRDIEVAVPGEPGPQRVATTCAYRAEFPDELRAAWEASVTAKRLARLGRKRVPDDLAIDHVERIEETLRMEREAAEAIHASAASRASATIRERREQEVVREAAEAHAIAEAEARATRRAAEDAAEQDDDLGEEVDDGRPLLEADEDDEDRALAAAQARQQADDAAAEVARQARWIGPEVQGAEVVPPPIWERDETVRQASLHLLDDILKDISKRKQGNNFSASPDTDDPYALSKNTELFSKRESGEDSTERDKPARPVG